MNARVKTKRTAPAQEAANLADGWVVVGVIKRRAWLGENRKGWIRRIIVDRANKDLPPQPEAASERNAINEGIEQSRDTNV